MTDKTLPARKALIPISIDNPGFSTTLMISALSAIKEKYDEFVFLVADDLQLYNKVTEVRSGAELSQALKLFKEKHIYFEEKKRWLEKLRKQSRGDVQNIKWTITNISNFTDRIFYNIWRNLTVFYQTIPQFRDDVTEAARQHHIRLRETFSDTQIRLSKFYIIEEIAINIRMRVCEGIGGEYYAFNSLKPLLKVYAGDYGISVFTLADLPEQIAEFAFYKFTNTPDAHWTKISKENLN
jgi:hypothetical protein